MSKEVPQLTENERLILRDIMSSMALESERVEKYKVMIDMCNNNLDILSGKLNEWKNQFNKKLKKVDLDMSMVNINTNTGKVTLDNVTTINVEKLNGVAK